MKRATKPPRPPVVHADDVEAEPLVEEELEEDDLETHRPPAPTVPFVPTPMVEWPPTRTPTFEDRHPSSHNMPTAPKQARPPSEQSMEAALRQQMWTGLASPPTQTAQTGPHIPVPLQQRAYAPAPPAPTSSSSVISSPGSSISG